MDEVGELLRAWELPALIPKFSEQAINNQALSALTPEEIKDLIPQIGPRVLFLRCWRASKAEFLSPNNISLPNLDLSDLEFGQDPKDISIVEEKENVPISNITNFIVLDENVPTNISDVNERTQSGLLENILVRSLETSSLLIYQGGLDGDSTRNLLASTIATEVLNQHKNSQICGAIYFKWANLIKELGKGPPLIIYPRARLPLVQFCKQEVNLYTKFLTKEDAYSN